MMTQLRSQLKLIMWILVFAFLGTIVFSWGMGGFKGRQETGVIGAELRKLTIIEESYEPLRNTTI